MAKKVGDAFVDVTAKTDKLKKGLGKSKGMIATFARGAAKSAAIAAAAAAAAVVAGAVVIAVKGVKAAMAAEMETAKLGAVLKATGFAAGFSSKEMQGFANELQNVTNFSNDAVNSTQAILATFKNIKGDEFKRATKSILDMSSVLGQDAKQGAIQLGKALNDPIKGVTALNRVGVSFTEEQKTQIKVMQEAGDVMGAQGIILKELESEFGGAAAAMRNTLGGSLKGLQNDWGDLSKAIGFAVADLFELKFVFNSTAEKVKGFTEKLSEMRDAGVFIQWSERIKKVMKSVGMVFTTAPGKWKEELAKIDAEAAANTERRIADLKKEQDAAGSMKQDVVEGEKEKQEEIKKTTSVLGGAASIWTKAQETAESVKKPGGNGVGQKGGGILDVDIGKAAPGVQDHGPTTFEEKMLKELRGIKKATEEQAVFA